MVNVRNDGNIAEIIGSFLGHIGWAGPAYAGRNTVIKRRDYTDRWPKAYQQGILSYLSADRV